MNDTMKTALKDWLADREIKMAGKENSAIFISNQTTRICPATIDAIVKKYSKEALGFEISPHKLRAAFCTELYNRTRDIEFVRRAVGHSHVDTTRRYIVDDDSAKDKAAELMKKIYG